MLCFRTFLFIFLTMSIVSCSSGDGSENFSFERALVDTDADGVPDSTDTDDDNDGVDDVRDAFPLDDSETADFDGDGIGDNADSDDDNDGVNDEEDAFPLDATETADTDSDGTGDNSDAYPDQSACHKANEGDGTECYATVLAKYDVSEIVASRDGFFFFLVAENNTVVVFDSAESSYSAVALELDDAESPTELAYSENNGRLYIGFSNGRIAYLEKATNQVSEFAAINESVNGLASVGKYVLAQDDSGSWESHFVFDVKGQNTAHVEGSHYSEFYAWNPALSRVYFFSDARWPKDILFEEINQTTGQVTAEGDSPYHGDYSFSGPIRVSPDGEKVFVGPGDIYDAQSLERVRSIGISVDDALWTETAGLIVFQQLAGSVRLSRYDSDYHLVETRVFQGELLGAFQLADRIIVLLEHNNTFEFTVYDQHDDSDGDGVENAVDRFPADAAASEDADNDGAPDSWNVGFSQADSSTGLVLDAFPQDSICQLEVHGVNGVCDIVSRVELHSAEQAIVDGDVAYVLSSDDMRVNRWQISTETLLNPVLLSADDSAGSPIAMTVSHSGELLVTYQGGHIYQYPANGMGRSSLFTVLPEAVQEIFTATAHYIVVVRDEENYYPDLYLIDTDGNTLDAYAYLDPSSVYGLGEASQRFYWIVNRNNASIESVRIDGSLGQFYDYRNSFHPIAPGSFMALSGDEKVILTGGGTVVENYLDVASYSSLTPGATLSDDAVLQGFVWLDDIAVALYEDDSANALTVYSHDLSTVYADIEQENEIVFIASVGNDIVALEERSSGLHFKRLQLMADEDSDSMPLWWELAYGLSDKNAGDGTTDLDSDNLTNRQEFEAGTLPNNSDSDGDGLMDDVELSLGVDPLVADTDGDKLPDGWEVDNGLDANNASDAALDSDSDGVSNYHEYLQETDPQDSDSTPDSISSASYSFEDSAAPVGWSVDGEPVFSTAQAYEGAISMAFRSDAEIEWVGQFDDVEFTFYTVSDCYDSYSKSISVKIDGERLSNDYIHQRGWQKNQILISKGYHTLSLKVDSGLDSCDVYLDAVLVAPLRSVYELGVKLASQQDDTLFLYNGNEELVREVAIPGQLDYSDYARDIVILDDGRIAVFNGTFSPVLSYYTPETNTWEHIQAPSWSTINNLTYGGIDALGAKVYVTNMSTAGNTTSGIVEFDLDSKQVTYHDGFELFDLTVGLDGFIYGLDDSTVYKYDPVSFTLIKTIPISSSRSIAVDADGSIFSATWGGEIIHHYAAGTVVDTFSFGGSFFDISISESGEVIASNRDNQVFTTNKQFTSHRELSLTGSFIDFAPSIDSDGDGLPDWWEGGVGLDRVNPDDAVNDLDGDGLTALEEYTLGTRENEPDSDGDGLSDGDEYFTVGSDPLNPDTDGDWLTDQIEVEIGSNPLLVDTDGDSLSDAREYLETGTNPLASDSDDDGMSDGYEIEYGLNAFVDDAAIDLDGDLLSNIEEHNAQTNPNSSDTDGDTLGDFDELNTYATSPTMIDSDGDKLRDDWEVTYSLDPNDPATAGQDADSDLFTNLEEYYAGSDPLVSSSVPQPIDWQTHQGDASHTGYTPFVLDEQNFTLKWEFSKEGITEFNPVTASASQVFVSTNDYFDYQDIFALDASTGEIQWELNYDRIHSINAPAFYNNSVYFQTGGHDDSYIRSVNAETGELDFQSSYGNQWSRYLAPTYFGGSIYMAGGSYGGVYGFDATSGDEQWFFRTPQYDEFTPAVDDNYVYAFTTQLDIINRVDGTLHATIAFPGFDWRGYAVEVATVLTKDGNVVVTQQGSLVVFDVGNESILWQKEDSGFYGQASVGGGVIYAVSHGSLYAIDESSGSTLWLTSEYSYNSNIVVTKTHIFVGDDSATYAIDTGSHQVVWSYPASGHLSVAKDGSLYIAGEGALVSISLQ